MREYENVGLRWENILREQIQNVQDEYPEIDVRSLFAPLISMLNSNRIPSKIILSSGKVEAYGYILPAMGIRDRAISSVGFVKDSISNLPRGEKIIEWLENETIREGKLLIIDGLYNSSFLEEALQSHGFTRSNRVKMIGDIDRIVEKLKRVDTSGISSKLELLHSAEVDPSAVSMAQLESYSTSPDRVLLIMEDGKNVTYSILLSGYYGKVLGSASLVAVNSSGILGSITVTDGLDEISYRGIPLIVDFFTEASRRHTGIGSYLLLRSVESLKLLGHTQVQLWVNTSAEAMEFYVNCGFIISGGENTTYWKDFRNSDK